MPSGSPFVPRSPRRARAVLLALVPAALLSLAPTCSDSPAGPFAFTAPELGLLSAAGDVDFRLAVPGGVDPASLQLLLDGQPVAPSVLVHGAGEVTGTLPSVAEGPHRLEARGLREGTWLDTATEFSLVALQNPDECEILNQVECVLPFPSSRFLEPADTVTGLRTVFGANTFPSFNRVAADRYGNMGNGPLDPTPFLQNDGFSPTAQVLMHFPGGVDPVASDAPRIDPATRVYGTRSLENDSPTLLIDYDTGERVLHWIENDAQALDPNDPFGFDPTRVVTFLRPGVSLRPGHRYIVAVRDLVSPSGAPVTAEPVFAAIRDGSPSDLPAVEERRAGLEPVLERLAGLGVERSDLILAFDFTVQSDHSLTHEMLTMRDESFAWLADQQAQGLSPFTVTSTNEVNPGCADPTQPIWREVRGTFSVPLYLDSDPYFRDPAQGIFRNREIGFLMRDASGKPVWNGTTEAPFGVAIPCAVFEPGGVRPLPPLVVGHGLFGDGPGTVSGLTQADALADFEFIAGATNWAGLSSPDVEGCNFDVGPDLSLDCFIVKVLGNLDNTEALADRLRQGQLATLVLTRMMKSGVFNAHPAFQAPSGEGVMEEELEAYYFGASLGGIMGTMFAALTPDVERLNVDVPAINFSLLLQRATPFLQLELLLDFLVNPDPLQQAVGFSAIHELWVRGEPAGYATHVTGDPLPGVPWPKRVLMTVALYDQQVSNLGSILAGASLGLPNLEGSVLKGLPGMPDVTGPRDSGFIVYDTASFDPANPAHLPFIPPLANEQAQPNRCDPHGRRGFIPASVDQLLTFLTPLGLIENFCTDDGICNASEPAEIPFGDAVACDPLG